MRRPLIWTLALAGALSAPLAGAPRAALAADESDAAALIERGLILRQAQRDAEALALFEKAQALAPSPRGQAQVALAQQALGRWVLAERNLRAALAVQGDACSTRGDRSSSARWPSSPRTSATSSSWGPRRGRCSSTASASRSPTRSRTCGSRSGDAPSSSGWRARTRSRAPSRFSPARSSASRSSSIRSWISRSAVDYPLPRPTPAAPTVEAGRTQRLLGWIALGGAGIFVATGVAGLAEREIAAGDFNGNASCTGQPSNHLSSQCSGWLDEGTTGQTLAIVGFVGGGVVGALSVALLATAPSSKARSAAVAFPCAPTSGGAFCSLQGAF